MRDDAADIDETDRPRPRLRAMPRRLAGGVVDLLLPPRCYLCRRRLAAGDTICATCWRAIPFVTAPLCNRLGIPLPYDTGGPTVSAAALARPPDFDRARAVARYDGRMRALVRQFKYGDQLELRALLGRMLLSAGRPLLADCDLIVPVPLYRRRLVWRRFNQSAVLAGEVGRLTGLPVDVVALQRIRRTRAQVGLSEAQRQANVRGAFRVGARQKPALEGRRVLLVDDVITTGATANACARALKRAGAASVEVLALAIATGEATHLT